MFCDLVASPSESIISFNDWSVSQVCDWLYSIHCKEETVDVFRDANMTGLSVAKLDLEDLKQLKIKVGDRYTIIHYREERIAAEQKRQEQLSSAIDVKKCLEKKSLRLLCGGEELQRRKWIESLEERTVTGLSWGEVNEMITAIRPGRKKIPTSTGPPVILDPGTITELSEIVVLGCNECEDEVKQLDHTQRESLTRAEEIRFYRGGPPSWWNFYFENQICCRDIHSGLYNEVKKILDSTSNDAVVERVRILHQPGAGGTTSAKHILWDLRKEYRVAVVHNCEDHRSSEKISRLATQILKLYQHEEREDAKSKPVLLFLDNPEEETEYCLFGQLTEMAKRIRRYGKHSQLICLFFICLRLTELLQDSNKGTTSDSMHVSLHHSLSDREREWFKSKHKVLQEKFEKAQEEEKDEHSSYVDAVSPKLLISFNILKENFDKDFIQSMARQFVANITDEKERKLLKYISLINVYDLEFRPLPLAAFDNVMATVEWKSCEKKENGNKQKHVFWENRLSGALRILMNVSSERGMGYIQSLRLANPLLAKEVLNCLKFNKEIGGEVETVCDIALEFFNGEKVFKVQSCPRERLMYVVKDVLNKCRRWVDRTLEQKFAPVILDIMENDDNGAENACRVLEEGYNLTQDAFVAQTLARLFTERKQWDSALRFAKIAINTFPNKSNLWDTYGCVYEKKLMVEREKYTSDVNWLARVVQLGMDGIDIFRRVQNLSEEEQFPNMAGYYGELRITINILECLKRFDEFRYPSCLKQFLIETDYVPQHVLPLTDMFGHNYVAEIKRLKENVAFVLHYLEDEKLQLRSKPFHRYEHDNLDKLKVKFNDYFGEDSDDPPEGLSEQKQCYYRQRRIFKLASNNTKGIFELRWKDDGFDRLLKIRDIVSKNVRSKEVDAVDYMTAINVELALSSLINATPQLQSQFTCNFDDILQWSLKLYSGRRKMRGTYLEPYLFLTMFNWPRENSQPLVTPPVIKTALKEWKDTYYEKHRRQRDNDNPYRKKNVTMFFLANGNGIESIYTWYEEQGFPRLNDKISAFWKDADAAKNLQRFKGTLCDGGRKLEYCFEGSTLLVQTSFPLDRAMWNKKVVFIIGLSWMGPKAFDVRLDSTMPSSPVKQ